MWMTAIIIVILKHFDKFILMPILRNVFELKLASEKIQRDSFCLFFGLHNNTYVQMPQARVWAHYISTLVLFLPDHRDLNSCVNPETQLKV